MGITCSDFVYTTLRSVKVDPRSNRFWEFHQIYNLGAVGDEDELIRF